VLPVPALLHRLALCAPFADLADLDTTVLQTLRSTVPQGASAHACVFNVDMLFMSVAVLD
jgi:hypothetical protein